MIRWTVGAAFPTSAGNCVRAVKARQGQPFGLPLPRLPALTAFVRLALVSIHRM